MPEEYHRQEDVYCKKDQTRQPQFEESVLAEKLEPVSELEPNQLDLFVSSTQRDIGGETLAPALQTKPQTVQGPFSN